MVEGVEQWPALLPFLSPLERLWRAPYRSRDEAIWENAAACAVSLWGADVVLLKPRHAWHPSGIGKRLFVPCTVQEQVERHLCHEVTHILTAHLKLPFWLNEGLAMLATDFYAGQDTVKPQTRQFINARPKPLQVTSDLSRVNADEWLTAYAQGYWMPRHLAEHHSALLKRRLWG